MKLWNRKQESGKRWLFAKSGIGIACIASIASLFSTSQLQAQSPDLKEKLDRQKKGLEKQKLKLDEMLMKLQIGKLNPEVEVFGDLRMMKRERLPEVFIGLSLSRTSPATAAQLGLSKGMGLNVLRVDKGSPAEKSKLKVHDVLYKLDDQFLVNVDQLHALLERYKVGDKAAVSFYRGGKLQKVAVQLEERKEKFKARPAMQFQDMDIWGGVLPRNGGKDFPGGFQDDGVDWIPPSEEGDVMDSLKLRKGGKNGGFAIEEIELDIDMLKDLALKSKVATVFGKIVKFQDDEGGYLLKDTEDGLLFEARDENSKLLFKGHIEPEANWDKVPEKFHAQVEKLKKILDSTVKKGKR